MWLILLTAFLLIFVIALLVYALRNVVVTIEIGARNVKIAWLGLNVHVGERIIEIGKPNE